MTDAELERIRNRCNSTRYGDDHVAVLVQAQNDARALFREVKRLRTVIGQLRAALRDCMSYVDVDNLTTQTKERNWQAVLDGKPWNSANVDVSARNGGE